MNQIKSTERVRDHGEVFTPQNTVNDMLNMMKQEISRIGSRVLEPSCGEGVFLMEVLHRKLAIVKRRYKKSQMDYEYKAMEVICNLYGLDIQRDNVHICRDNLLVILSKEYSKIFKKKVNKDFIKSIRHILKKNIICGDAFNLEVATGSNVVSLPEWGFTGKNKKVTRTNFFLSKLMQAVESKTCPDPTSAKPYPATYYRKLWTQHVK